MTKVIHAPGSAVRCGASHCLTTDHYTFLYRFMLVFYIFGFYMVLLIMTVVVLLLLYCFDFMP